MEIEDSTNVSLYVGDLCREVSEVNLMKLFGENKVSSCKVVRDMNSKRSMGYGYVNFSSHEEASKAFDRFNQTLCLGKPLRIMWALKNPSSRKSARGNLVIKNIDKSIDSRTIFEAFKCFGKILSFKICTNDLGHSCGYGFIHFSTEEEADHVIKRVNGIMFKGKLVQIVKFLPRSERASTGPPPFNNLFIKNFTDADVDTIVSKFAEIGTIGSQHFPKDGEKTKGFGFVCFVKYEHAKLALEMKGLVGANGNTIFINRALKKSEREAELRVTREENKMKMHNETKNRNLYVRGFPDNWTDEDLKACFAKYGEITSCKVILGEDGKSKFFGFVCFATVESTSDAIQNENTRKIDGKPLYVVKAQTMDERKYTMANQFNQLKNVGQNNMHPSNPRMQQPPMSSYQQPAFNQGFPPMDYRGNIRQMERGQMYPFPMRAPMGGFAIPSAGNMPQSSGVVGPSLPPPTKPGQMVSLQMGANAAGQVMPQRLPNYRQFNQEMPAVAQYSRGGNFIPQQNIPRYGESQRFEKPRQVDQQVRPAAPQEHLKTEYVSKILGHPAPSNFMSFITDLLNKGQLSSSNIDAEIKSLHDNFKG